MPTLPNFYVFMPTAGDKIEKISANRATVRTEEVGNCKTVSSSGMARRMAVPSRPIYRSNGRVRRRYPFSKKGRKLAQGVLCEPSPSVKSKSKSSDSVQIEVRNYADQQNQTDASENSTTETPAYKKEIDADVSFSLKILMTTRQRIIPLSKINGINRKRQKSFSFGKVLIDGEIKGREIVRPPSARSFYKYYE